MNLFNFLSRGAAHAPTDSERRAAKLAEAAEKARAQWLQALLTDEIRAWVNIGEADRKVLTGLTTMLTIAGFAGVYDTRDVESADIRVIRGAISAATQCAAAGCVITADTAQAFASAAGRARVLIETASHEAILHAAQEIRAVVNLDEVLA